MPHGKTGQFWHHSLARHIQKEGGQGKIFKSLSESFQAQVWPQSVCPWVKHSVVTEAHLALQTFGHAVFGPTSRMRFLERWSHLFGLDLGGLETWWELLGDQILEDLHVLGVVSSVPNPAQLDFCFYRDVSRRILAADPNEATCFALDLFDENWVRDARSHAEALLAMPGRQLCSGNANFPSLFSLCLSENVNLFKENPLALLAWRIEFLTSKPFQEIDSLFLRIQNPTLEQECLACAGLLLALSELRDTHGHLLGPVTPARTSEISRWLENRKIPEVLGQLGGKWDTQHVPTLLHRALNFDLVYLTRTGKTQSWGLTRAGFRVVQPFRSLASELFASEDVAVSMPHGTATESPDTHPSDAVPAPSLHEKGALGVFR